MLPGDGRGPGARSALSFWLSNEPSSVTRARQYAKVAAREWGMDGGIPAALLVVSELVGNAVRHTSSVIHVRLEHHGSRMRITVDDCEPGLVLRKDPDAMDDDGRGLVIVEAFALAWGVEQDADGKHVWADVAFP